MLSHQQEQGHHGGSSAAPGAMPWEKGTGDGFITGPGWCRQDGGNHLVWDGGKEKEGLNLRNKSQGAPCTFWPKIRPWLKTRND